MLTTTEVAGYVGAGLAGAAYVPQISHLIRARCSAGISRPAFELWLLASLLTTAHAIAIHAGVFIVLGGIQIVATTLIMLYAGRYKDRSCPSHLPRPPRTRKAARTGSSGKEPGSWRPAGLASHQQGGGAMTRAVLGELLSGTAGVPANGEDSSLRLGRSVVRAHPASAARTLRFIPSAVHRIQARHLRGTR